MITEYEISKQAIYIAIVALEQAIDAEREVQGKSKYVRSLAEDLTNSAMDALDNSISLTLGIVEERQKEVSSTTGDSAKSEGDSHASSTTTCSGYTQLSFT